MKNSTTAVVLWGTYDTTKPRVRIIVEALKKFGLLSGNCHMDIWSAVKDKSMLTPFGAVYKLLKMFSAYPKLIREYKKTVDHNIVIILYPGIVDLFVFVLFCKGRKDIKLIYDIFVPVYDAVVNDRNLLKRRNPLSMILKFIEKKAVQLSDVSLLDTNVHCRYFSDLYSVDIKKLRRLLVGAEDRFFNFKVSDDIVVENRHRFNVLFYGQFIPLHGIDIIVEAAHLIEQSGEEGITFTIIGKGQEQEKIDKLIKERELTSVERIFWVNEKSLPHFIKKADLCLGIFGISRKAESVIPNKLFQVLAMGKPVITKDTPAVRELLEFRPSLPVIQVGSPLKNSLAEKIRDLKRERYFSDEGQNIAVGVYDVATMLMETLKEFQEE